MHQSDHLLRTPTTADQGWISTLKQAVQTNHQAASLLCKKSPFTFRRTIWIFIRDNKFTFLQNSLLCYDNLMSGELLRHKQLENHSHACMPEWNYWRLDSALMIFFPPPFRWKMYPQHVEMPRRPVTGRHRRLINGEPSHGGVREKVGEVGDLF